MWEAPQRAGATAPLFVFRIGNATNNISWQSYQEIARNPNIQWTIPISLGDSHKGYRVLGTNVDYFKHFRYSGKRRLEMAKGRIFEGIYDAVLGAEVAEKLGYGLNDEIILAHGAGKVSFIQHADKPFKVVGILKRTGTPVDQTIHVRLEGIEAIHIDWKEEPSPSRASPSRLKTRLKWICRPGSSRPFSWA